VEWKIEIRFKKYIKGLGINGIRKPDVAQVFIISREDKA